MNHLAVLIVLTLCVSCMGQGVTTPSRPIVGAIRWDAWTGGFATDYVERSLSPAKYHYRMPWFGKVVGDQQVKIDGSSQEIMDQEIAFAADAGLDYWAFVLYETEVPLSLALTNYLRSPQRDRLKFCLILHSSFNATAARWPVERDRTLALLKEPSYQTVLGGRPLVYAFEMKHQGQFAAERFAEFRRMAQEAGLNPYYVFMGWSHGTDFAFASKHGFDAVSSYAAVAKVATFAQLSQFIETNSWGYMATAGLPFVPLVSTGWDPSPRNENPMPWGTGGHDDRCVPTATPAEVAGHLKNAVAFVQKNPKVCPANAIIIYAWNENDEGGWLVPTWTAEGKPDAQRLNAIRAVLRPEAAATGPSR